MAMAMTMALKYPNMHFFCCNSEIFHSFSLAGSLTMNTEETNSYLVTGDADGLIKVWDINDYCVTGNVLRKDPPRKYIFEM